MGGEVSSLVSVALWPPDDLSEEELEDEEEDDELAMPQHSRLLWPQFPLPLAQQSRVDPKPPPPRH